MSRKINNTATSTDGDVAATRTVNVDVGSIALVVADGEHMIPAVAIRTIQVETSIAAPSDDVKLASVLFS